MSDSIDDLARAVQQFARDRDWGQFHSPKNLAAALTVEAAELLEHFQWLTEEQSRNLPEPTDPEWSLVSVQGGPNGDKRREGRRCAAPRHRRP